MIKRLRTQVLKKLNIFYWCSLLRQFDSICGYKGFSRSLVFAFGVFSDNIIVCFNLWFQILRPTFPGMMRYIAKNIFNLVNPSFLFDITKQKLEGKPTFCRHAIVKALNSMGCKIYFDISSLIASCQLTLICSNIDSAIYRTNDDPADKY